MKKDFKICLLAMISIIVIISICLWVRPIDTWDFLAILGLISAVVLPVYVLHRTRMNRTEDIAINEVHKVVRECIEKLLASARLPRAVKAETWFVIDSLKDLDNAFAGYKNYDNFYEKIQEKHAIESEASAKMLLRSIGTVRSEIEKPSLLAGPRDLERQQKVREQKEWRDVVSEIVINSSLVEALEGIEEFSHLLVLYWAHRVPPDARSLTKVHPMGRKDLPLVGVFSTCSPARPNPIGVTAVRLLERKGNVLRVEGLDAIDGTPVIDIKPYNPVYYTASEVKVADWMLRLQKDLHSAGAAE